MRAYGKVTFSDNHWHVEAEPHVIIRLKNVFPRAEKTARGTVTLANADDVCRDLLWFMDRYELEIEDATLKLLKKAARRHNDTILRLEQMIDSTYKPKAFPLALPGRDYQRAVAEIFLARGSLLVADDVGLGKTVEAFCALTDPRTLPAAIVTLSGTMPQQWRDQFLKFMPDMSVHVIRKGTPYELPKFFGRGPDAVILNYHKLSGWADTLAAYCKTVVFDEVQELRHSDSDKYRGAEILAGACDFRLGLSATPIYNYGGEIYNVVNTLRPGCVGEWGEFTREWCSFIGNNKYSINDPKAFGTYLREQFIMVRRTRAEVGRELPPLQKIPQRVEMDTEPMDAIAESVAQLAQIILAGTNLDKGDEMRAAGEIDWKLRHATGVGKAPHVGDFVRLLVESGEKVLVYAWHHAVYDILRARLIDYDPASITGEQSVPAKLEAKRRFIEGETPVLLMSLRAGAGVDGLQAVCRTIVFAEIDWSPGVHEQCIGRIFRDGQKDPVTAYFLIADAGSDPVVSETLGLKREQVEGIKDPTRKMVEDLQADGGRAKSLAKFYLEKVGKKVEPLQERDTKVEVSGR